MADVVLFHHAHGLTPGVLRFAELLRADGRSVHTPDLFEGRTFASLDEGVAYGDDLGLEAVIERGRAAVQGLPEGTVYAGLSLGAMVAQALAQTSAGAKGALLVSAAAPAAWFGEWPEGLALQIHVAENDQWVDMAAARGLANSVGGAELFVYPGDHHLFVDEALPDYDPESARLLTERALTFVRQAG